MWWGKFFQVGGMNKFLAGEGRLPSIPLWGKPFYQAFIQALLSTAVFSQRLSFSLFIKLVNLDIQIAGKYISTL